MAESCPQPRQDCRWADTGECYQTVHHKLWPASEYVGYIATHFRNLPEHKETLRRCDHEELHRTTSPPERPSEEFMAGYLIANQHKIGISAVKRIRRELRGKRTN